MNSQHQLHQRPDHRAAGDVARRRVGQHRKDRRADHGHHQVAGRAGRRDHREVALGVLAGARVSTGTGFAQPISGTFVSMRDQRKQQRADRVDVHGRD